MSHRACVSDLRIPRASPLLTAVQGWRLTPDESSDTFDFPRPLCEEESSASGSGSGSESGSFTSPATTSSPSPTIAAHSVPSLTRCKSIKLLTITKRSLSPAPPPDADDFYVAHASTFITLAAPLPPSILASSSSTHASASRSRRESIVLPGSAPTPHRAPCTSAARCPSPRGRGHRRPSTPARRAATAPSSRLPFRRCSRLSPSPRVLPLRCPPRRPRARVQAPIASRPSSPRPRASSQQSHTACSPTNDEWDERDYEHASNDIPLSPLVAPAPASPPSSPSPIEVGECSPIEYAATAADENEQSDEDGAQAGYADFPSTPPEHEQELRALHSRWSSSTLSSVHSTSVHAHAPRSPRTFAFARRYFPSASPAKAAAKPAAYPSRVRKKAAGKKAVGKGKGKRLTAADVRVLGLGSATPFTSSSSSSSPASTSTPSSSASVHLPLQTPAIAPFAPYPHPYSVPPPLLPSPFPSTAFHAAYTTQRSPRRRAFTASASSRSSSSVRHSGLSESGQSECSASAGGEGGLRRKPIPVGLFLR
ncbi:hypothetical protein DFH09DRAFT_1504069 [Mycena vulgaris]|nr:hypothetical protein DFH09DRAFT_1504069 [Mycena vulgaris]